MIRKLQSFSLWPCRLYDQLGDIFQLLDELGLIDYNSNSFSGISTVRQRTAVSSCWFLLESVSIFGDQMLVLQIHLWPINICFPLASVGLLAVYLLSLHRMVARVDPSYRQRGGALASSQFFSKVIFVRRECWPVRALLLHKFL